MSGDSPGTASACHGAGGGTAHAPRPPVPPPSVTRTPPGTAPSPSWPDAALPRREHRPAAPPAGRRPPRQLTCAYAQLTSPRGPAASLPPRPSIWLIPPPHALLYGLAPGERLPVAPRGTGAEPDIRTPQLRCDQTELRRRTPTVSAQCRSLPRGGGGGSAGSRRVRAHAPAGHLAPHGPAAARGKARRVRPSPPAQHSRTRSIGGTTDRRPGERRPAPPCPPPAE